MNAPSTIADIFRNWCMAELAAHFATPCPDEVMDHLVDAAHAEVEFLAGQPANDAADLLLKVYPLLLANFEPARHSHPLVLSSDNEANGSPSLLQSVMGDFVRLCPEVAEAVAMESPHARRAA